MAQELFPGLPTDLVDFVEDTSKNENTLIGLELQKRKYGKIWVIITNLNLQKPELKDLLKLIKNKLACAGTIKNNALEVLFGKTDKTKDLIKILESEGFSENNISITGNTVIDALHWVLEHSSPMDVVLPFELQQSRMILVTGHRRENFGSGFQQICEALRIIALKQPDIQIVYPVHLNPNVREPVNRILSNLPNLHLTEPLDYQQFVHLMNQSTLILTDSGGVQEEAPSLGKPVLVMRDTTERPEAVEAGTVKLVGVNQQTIVDETMRLLNNSDAYQKMAYAHNPYGDGTASEKILEALLNFERMSRFQ